jgi:hypothetical protein
MSGIVLMVRGLLQSVRVVKYADKFIHRMAEGISGLSYCWRPNNGLPLAGVRTNELTNDVVCTARPLKNAIQNEWGIEICGAGDIFAEIAESKKQVLVRLS